MNTVIPNPLQELHLQAEGEMMGYGEVGIVSTFGEVEAEYAAIRKSAGMMDLPQRGILEVGGEERGKFVNNYLTNDVLRGAVKKDSGVYGTVYGFMLNSKGRIVTDVNVLELGDRMWLEMEARKVEEVRGMLEKYRFAEKVTMESKVGALHEIAVHGPGAGEVVGRELGAGEAVRHLVFGVEGVVWRDDPAGVPGYFLVVPAEKAREVWMKMLERFGGGSEVGKRKLRPVGWAAFNATRIEGGRALFGVDFDETVLPAETGQLERAVSFTKGCYLGQEIVARMHARGQAARQLVRFRMKGEELPVAGTPLMDGEGNVVGVVTSSTLSPVMSNAAIGMGMVKKGFAEKGAVVRVAAEGGMREAVVVEGPFLRVDSSQ